MLMTFLSISFLGCKVYQWNFEKELSEVEKIEIIYINSFYEDEYELLKEIPQTESVNIISDIQKLQAKRYIGGLTVPSGQTIKILFKNGDYDLISLFEPRHIYLNDGGITNIKTTRLCFNQEEFNHLIDKWLNK